VTLVLDCPSVEPSLRPVLLTFALTACMPKPLCTIEGAELVIGPGVVNLADIDLTGVSSVAIVGSTTIQAGADERFVVPEETSVVMQGTMTLRYGSPRVPPFNM